MFLSSYHHENFRGYYHWQKWCPQKRSKSDVKVQGYKGNKMPQLGCFRTITPVWIQRWLRNEEAPSCFSRSSVKFLGHTAEKSTILTQIERFRTVTPVWIHRWLGNDAQSLKWLRRGVLLFFKVVCGISRSRGPKNRWFNSDFSVSGWQLQFEFMDGYEMILYI